MTKEQYGSIADAYAEMLNPTKEFVLVPTFQVLSGDVEDRCVLDLACGEGFFTRILARQHPKELIGFDYSEAFIKKAKAKEEAHPLGIEYKVGNVLSMDLGRQFDVITAAFLLNYAESEDELYQMCCKIYDHLADGGQFGTLTTHPMMRPDEKIIYERKVVSVSGKDYFENGDIVRCELREEGKIPFDIDSFFWSKQTYERCFERAGFQSVEWVEPIIGQEGINKFGDEYWDYFRENPSFSGIICKK